MSHSSDSRKGAHDNSDDPNIIQLGFNISVAGKSASDVEIYVNDKKQPCGQLPFSTLKQITSSAEHSVNQRGEKSRGQGPLDPLPESEESDNKDSRRQKNDESLSSAASVETEGGNIKSSRGEDVRIIDEIKNAMGNFEKFSEHLREIPRLSTKRVYTSTPFPDKSNSRSEGNLALCGNVPRSYVPKHDFRDGKYFRRPKPLPNDLFLKPLPAEDYFKKGYIRRYYDVESYHHYASMDNLPNYYEYGGEWKDSGKISKSDNEKSDALSSASDACVSESKAPLKKGSGNESADKQSTSSESAKDIKIYQSGGIIIMQNFKDSADKDMVDGAKLIENCNKLKEKMESSLQSSDESQKLLLNSSSDDVKGQSTKSVQFDLSSFENNRSKSCDSSSDMPKSDLTNHRSEISKGKDSGLIIPQNQDFTSLSTQENDSVISNMLGMSPTSSTSGRKLEWDSGADVGYLNMDLTTENISTIERIILRGLTDDGMSKKQIIYQRNEHDKSSRSSKYILERMPSELEIEIPNDCVPKNSGSDQRNLPSGGASASATNDPILGSKDCASKRQSNENNGSKGDKHQTVSTDKHKQSKKTKLVKNHQNSNPSKPERRFDETKKVETLSDVKTKSREEKFAQTPKMKLNKESALSSDKSTYVNTLFDDWCFELPLQDLSRSDESGRSESSDRMVPCAIASPRVKKLKKKKEIIQGNNSAEIQRKKAESATEKVTKITEETKKPDESVLPAESVDVTQVTGAEKRHDNLNSNLQNTKFNPSGNSSSMDKPHHKDKISQSRPISGSSSSIRTVLPIKDAPETANAPQDGKNFLDQMIQTCELLCESKGIQAFQSAHCSLASSQIGDVESAKLEEIAVNISGVEVLRDEDRNRPLLGCSKSIQAPGMNSSLPKHLAHPKQSVSFHQKNTKSTQFFGAPVTSLPNYHSNVSVRESAIGKDNLIKKKADFNSRIIQNNIKNPTDVRQNDKGVKECILAPVSNTNSIDDGIDIQQKRANKGARKDKSDIEDKENLSLDEEDLTDCSKRQSNGSRKETKTNGSAVSGSKKSDSLAFGSCEVLPSEDGKNVFLTSELLKEHGDRIDRNIIKEKYFKSQLQEFERKKMVSRTTSMEKKTEYERNTQTSFSPVTGVSVSCQYSPSLINGNEEMMFYSKTNSGKSSNENGLERASTNQHSRDKYDFSQRSKDKRYNSMEDFADDDLVFDENLSSDTQTADSWVPGKQQDSGNQPGRALSFEYVSGHIYDEPASVKGKTLSGNERNLQLGDSIQSTESHSTSAAEKGERTDTSRQKNSENGNTLVLENTDRSPLESVRMESLNNNLSQLKLVVSRLHGKEAIFKKITDSVLSTMSKVNGSGDSQYNFEQSESYGNSYRTQDINSELKVLEKSNKSEGSDQKARKEEEKSKIINEISTACQTDTMKPDQVGLNEERKKLERRVNIEKDQQIKWIENEINHLNMLRSLLEKRENSRNSTQTKKRHHYLTETTEDRSATSTWKEEILRKILTESLPKAPPPSAELSLDKQSKLESTILKLTEESTMESLKHLSGSLSKNSQNPHLGLSLSLRRIEKAREVTMLPVGIQVTLRDKKERSKSDSASIRTKVSALSDQSEAPTKQTRGISANDVGENSRAPINQNTVAAAPERSCESLNKCGCYKCDKNKCKCLIEMSEKQQKEVREKSDLYEEENAASKIPQSSEEEVVEEIAVPEIRDVASSRRSSKSGSAVAMRSARKEVSHASSESFSDATHGTPQYEKCVCPCHAQPLPRCGSCHLLDTCKKCQCYRRIRYCVCETVVPVHSNCFPTPATCPCNIDVSMLCRCSKTPNQICLLCPCHTNADGEGSDWKCKKKLKERSSQTDRKEGRLIDAAETVVNDTDLYKETKFMTEMPHPTEEKTPSDLVYMSESRVGMESKKPVDEKFSYEMKVPVEQKKSADIRSKLERRREIERLSGEESRPINIKHLRGKPQCRCYSRETRRNTDVHPRKYFLEVEETTEEDSSGSRENLNETEVITIKVPIRKARNIHSSPKKSSRGPAENRSRDPRGDQEIGNEYSEQEMVELPECSCCEDCLGQPRKRTSIEERPRRAEPRHRSFPRNNVDWKRDVVECGCCADCPGATNFEERSRPDYPSYEDYALRNQREVPYPNFNSHERGRSSKKSKYPAEERRFHENRESGHCGCCQCGVTMEDWPSRRSSSPDSHKSARASPTQRNAGSVTSEFSSEIGSAIELEKGDHRPERKREKSIPKSDKLKKDGEKKKGGRKSSSSKNLRSRDGSKAIKGSSSEKSGDKSKNGDYYNFNKKEYMTKSELEREEKKKRPSRLTLQECLTIKRPDLYTRAECRRKIISEKSRDRAERQKKRWECLTRMLPQCDVPSSNPDLKLFTTAQMKKQTRKMYKNLPEIENKRLEKEKKLAYQTNKLLAEIYAKKLQLHTLNGRLNMPNSFSVMSTM